MIFFLKNLSQQTTILVFDYKDSHEKKMKDEIFFPHGFIIFQSVSDSKFGQSKWTNKRPKKSSLGINFKSIYFSSITKLFFANFWFIQPVKK